MAIPTVLTIAATSGVVASQIPSTGNGTPPTDLAWGGGVAIVVALIGGGVQIWVNRRRNNDPQLTVETRVAVLENNVAEIRQTVDEIEKHVHPWDPPLPRKGRQ